MHTAAVPVCVKEAAFLVSVFQLQSDERETRKQLMDFQTQWSLTLFALGSFEFSAALNKTAFILTRGFSFQFQAGFVCTASRFP